jgi:hypothetical protein
MVNRSAEGVYPPDVSVGGWHWLVDDCGDFLRAEWSPYAGVWYFDGGGAFADGLSGYRYVAPCPLPELPREPRVFCDELGNEVVL